MHRTVHFKTTESEEWTFDANGNPDVPGGKALAQKLCAAVAGAAQAVGTVEQHSYYGWRFEVAFKDVTVQCVLNAAGEESYFTVEVDSILPSWLLPRRVRRAFAELEVVFDTLLRELPGIHAVAWS